MYMPLIIPVTAFTGDPYAFLNLLESRNANISDVLPKIVRLLRAAEGTKKWGGKNAERRKAKPIDRKETRVLYGKSRGKIARSG